jgi:predicted nucleotide-binding protein
VPYDVKRLNSIHQGEADISDHDAVVEIVAGLVETMVKAQRTTTVALENRYRNQLRTLREVMRRLGIEAELPASLRAWATTQPKNVPASWSRESIEKDFEPLLADLNDADLARAPNSRSMSMPDRDSEAVIGPQRRMLELIYEMFAATGQPPLFQSISAPLWQELQVEPREVYLDLAERRLVTPAMGRGHHFQLREDTPVGVSLQGMMYLPQAAEDLSRFVSMVRYVADRAARFRPLSATELDRLSVTSEEIRLNLELEPGDRGVPRLGALLTTEAWQLWNSFAGPNSEGWSFEVNIERARRYRDIHTVIEFLAVSYPGGQEQQQPASPTSLDSMNTLPTVNNKKVMVVHGRDVKTRSDLFGLLRAFGLEPIEWSEAVRSTGKGAPYNAEAVEAAFETAQAAIILLVPEEQVLLRGDLRDPKDPSDAQVAWQPRPNVFYEGGIAFTSHPDRAIIVEHGRPRLATDLAGRNTVRITSGPTWRHELANRLRDAGCPVTTESSEWLSVGAFLEPDLHAESSPVTGEVDPV